MNHARVPYPAELDPAVAALIDGARAAAYPPIYQLPVQQARQVYQTSVSITAQPLVELPRMADLSLDLPGGLNLRARLWAPSRAANLPVLLYFHGGGFVIGSLETCEAMCRQVALQSGAAVLAIDYRLAPEAPFPAAFDDCFAALLWLRQHGAELGLDPQRIALGGDSAGGTLCATTALLARDAQIPIKQQLMFYPSVQLSMRTASYERYADHLLLNRQLMTWFDQLLNTAQHPIDWRREPLRAADHRGLAPAWIGLAQCDALADDGRMYAARLTEAGVAVQVQEWPGQIHDFINMGRLMPQAAAAHSAFALALKQGLAR